MSGINGRRKGALGENEVRDLITPWWDQIEPGCKFVRTPGSGGWANAKVRGDFEASGDLMTSASTFPFVIEVKRREEGTIRNIREGKPTAIWAWWRQAQHAAREHAVGVPMLWWRRNAVTGQPAPPWRIMMPQGWLVRRMGRAITELGAPDMKWAKDHQWTLNLERQDAGAHPIVYLAAAVLAVSPKLFAVRH